TLQSILRHFPEALIAIDTFRSAVAEKAIEAGAVMVNDISAGNLDKNMMALVSKKQVPYILMHMRGTPQTMAQLTDYGNVTLEVIRFFSEKLVEARNNGINDLIVDPGFGFAKTATQSFELLAHLELFKSFEVPVLVGLSRKSMIYKTLKSSPEAALNGTTALHSIALLKGANILRVHDVKEALECITLMENFKI
ncbi:MAG TPA: dihydropteroate synthase, partial [Flavobacteriaceae bacterium]|nr:dihydropteroate synthase [Flavobacteriaceae bacterium]